ncbi:Imm15 family immunity protein [Actinomadura harenae]|nr:Imm15 family immunity protein [Actinomadura harenae]
MSDDGFDALLAGEGLDDLDGFFGPVEDFDEVPLYSRYAQLEFLSGLPWPERNALLVRRAVECLARLAVRAAERGEGDFFAMVTVAGWDEYHDGGFLMPSIWYTRPSNGTLACLDLVAAADADARFVADAVSAVAGARVLRVRSSEAEPSRFERVYVTVPPMS